MDTMMIDQEDRAKNQRDFYMKLIPQGGQMIAQHLAGFLPPGVDSLEAETRDSMSLWMKIHHGGAYQVLLDDSWWMTQYMDQSRRMTRGEAQMRSDELISYGVAVIGQLMDKHIIQFVTEPEIPVFVTSTYDPINQDVEQAVIDRMEAAFVTEDEVPDEVPE